MKHLNIKSPHTIAYIVFFFTMFLMAIATISFFIISKEEPVVYQTTPQQIVSEQWILNGKEEISFPNTLILGKNKQLTLSCQLPSKINPHDALFYNACYSKQEVFVDDKLIWDFATKPQLPFNAMYGSTYALIDLRPEYEGKTLTIVMQNPYINANYNFDGVFYGDKGEFKFSLLRKNMWRLTVFTVFCFTAVLCFIYAWYVRGNRTARMGSQAFVYYALLVFFVGLWILCDPSIMQFYTGKTTFVQYLSLLSLLNIGANYMGLCSCFMHKHQRIFHISAYAGYFLILCTIVLYIAKICTPVDLLLLICLYAFFTLMVSLVVFVKHGKEYSFFHVVIIGMIVLFLGVCSTIALFLLDPAGIKAVISFTISFSFYTMCLFVIMVKNAIAVIRSSSESKMYHRLAFTDHLTNIPNRAAFEQRMDEILQENSVSGTVTLIMCDLNYLKRVNDTLGHDAGDQMIQGAARILQETFDTCYRLGGDEFAALLTDDDIPVAVRLQHLEQLIAEYNLENQIPLSIAVGYAQRKLPMSAEEHRDEFYREADNNMYENKKKMRAQR